MAHAESSRVSSRANGKNHGKSESNSVVELPANGVPARDASKRGRPSGPVLDAPSVAALTDTYLARWFVKRYGEALRYCPAWRSWLFLGGSVWLNDDRNRRLGWARDSIQSLIEELPRVEGKLEQGEFEKAVRRLESSRTLAAVIKMAESDPAIIVSPDAFDRNPFLLGCRHGALDLKEARLCRPNSLNSLSKSIPITYDEHADCPHWDDFLHQVMSGNEKLIAYLRRAAGYALTGDVSEQCLFLLHGTGRNGKSVFLNTLLHVLGDYGMSASNHLLTSAGRPQKSTELAELAGKRLVVVCEPNGGRLDESLVKWLTGGEKIRARRSRGDDFEFQPTHKFFMASNHKPEIRETGEAMWRRIRLIPFSVTIPLEKEDKRLSAKLQEEAAGILNWMIKGCLEWQKQGLSEPESVREATRDFRAEMDPIGDFITERCNQGADLRERTTKLFTGYKQWSDQEGVPVEERVANETQFGTLLSQRGIVAKKTRGVMVRLQIGLKQQKELEPAPAGPEASPDQSQAGTPYDEAGLTAEQERASEASESNSQTVETEVQEALAAAESSDNEASDDNWVDEYPDDYADEQQDPPSHSFLVPSSRLRRWRMC